MYNQQCCYCPELILQGQQVYSIEITDDYGDKYIYTGHKDCIYAVKKKHDEIVSKSKSKIRLETLEKKLKLKRG